MPDAKDAIRFMLIHAAGYMIFETPNDASLEMQYILYNLPRVFACNIFPPMHLNAFSTQNAVHFLMRSGFCVEEISTPGNFDVEIFELEKEHIANETLAAILFSERQTFIQNSHNVCCVFEFNSVL